MARVRKKKKPLKVPVGKVPKAKKVRKAHGLMDDPETCTSCGEPFLLVDGVTLIPEGTAEARTFRHLEAEACPAA